MKTKASVAAIVAALAACLHTTASAQTDPLPDAGVHSQYETSISHTYVYWRTCGTIGDVTRCFSIGGVHGFGEIGALLLGAPVADGNVVTRALYVLDTAAGTQGNQMTLRVFRRTDQITDNNDIVSVLPVASLVLPLAGGPSAVPSMAANDVALFIGSIGSEKVVKVDKQTLAVTQVKQSHPGVTVTSITADEAGYVTVNWGEKDSYPVSFGLFGPDGELLENGPGPEFELNTRNALLLNTVP